MVVIGKKNLTPGNDEMIKWWLYMLYIILMNLLNMKLLISVIGQTWTRSQISRVFTKYDMKTQYLSEVSEFMFRVKELYNKLTNRNGKNKN